MPNFLPPTHTCQLTPSTHRAELLKTIRDAKVFANRDTAIFGEAHPSFMEPLKFYNPNAMAASYGAIGSGLSAALNA